jgi:hypothetical protein
MKITVTCNTVPGSIADRLEKQLGRKPTNLELKAEFNRIISSTRRR